MATSGEFDPNKFRTFLDELDFLSINGDGSIQSLLQYYCLLGVKENEFSAILALYLQQHSRNHTDKFTVKLNSSLSRNFGTLIDVLQTQKAEVLNLTTIDNSNEAILKKAVGIKKSGKLGGRLVSDIQILDLNSKPLHIIELKSDRCRMYLSELGQYNVSGKYNKKGCVQGLITDLKVLATLQAFALYQRTTFWQGVLVYSFQEDGKPFPRAFPKYITNESGTKGRHRRVPEISDPEDERKWFSICNDETEKLGAELDTFLQKQDYLIPPKEIYTIKVAEGTVNLHKTHSYSGARVSVQSQLMFFEVKANEKYLQHIAPQINNLYQTAAQRSNRKND